MRRLVFFGPPLAGKTTLLQALAGARGGRVQRCRTSGRESPPADFGAKVSFNVGETPCEAVTIPGCPLDNKGWRQLLADADASILVLDPQSTRVEAGRASMALAEPGDGALKLGCVILTKQDLVAEGVPAVTAEVLLAKTPFRDWPVFLTLIDEPDTLKKPLEWLLERFASTMPEETMK